MVETTQFLRPLTSNGIIIFLEISALAWGDGDLGPVILSIEFVLYILRLTLERPLPGLPVKAELAKIKQLMIWYYSLSVFLATRLCPVWHWPSWPPPLGQRDSTCLFSVTKFHFSSGQNTPRCQRWDKRCWVWSILVLYLAVPDSKKKFRGVECVIVGMIILNSTTDEWMSSHWSSFNDLWVRLPSWFLRVVFPHQTCHNFSWRVDTPLTGPPYPRLSEVMQRGSEAWGRDLEVEKYTDSMKADLNDNTVKLLDIFWFWCIDRILIATNGSCRTTFVLERILTLV